MNELATLDAYGVLTEPATLKIQRLLPGPIERVWAYLTESDLRRQWLAAGQMEMKVGAPVRARLAQQRADQPARPAAARLRRRAPDGEPDHRARSAPQARLHLGKAAATFRLNSSQRARGAAHRDPSPPARPRNACLASAPAGTCTSTFWSPALTGTEPEPFWDGWSRLQERIRPAHPGLTETRRPTVN